MVALNAAFRLSFKMCRMLRLISPVALWCLMSSDNTVSSPETIVVLSVYLYCRLNNRSSLVNSHLYAPRCVSPRSRLPTVCQCDDNRQLPSCVNENTIFDPSLPTVTYLTSLTDTCLRTGPARYVNNLSQPEHVTNALLLCILSRRPHQALHCVRLSVPCAYSHMLTDISTRRYSRLAIGCKWVISTKAYSQ